MPAELERWLVSCADRLGPECVRRLADASLETVAAPPAANVSCFRSRRVPAVVRARCVDDVIWVVGSLARDVPGAALYPVSTGRNWGFGSAEPVRDGCVVLDLADMRQIRALDTELGAAVIESGVTQGQLARALTGTPFMLNVTSASQHTSVIGNALERGVGTRRQRCEDVAGLEIVLADGELLRLGSWPDEARISAPYRYELGPGLMPLFFQSNFGVVTAAVVRLLPRPLSARVLRLTFDPERLGDAVDILRSYWAQNLIRGYLKVLLDGTAAPPGDGSRRCATALTCVDGDPELVAASATVLTDRTRTSGVFDTVEWLDQTAADRSPVVNALLGDPSRNDLTILDTFGTDAEGVDRQGNIGWLFFAPVIPFTRDAVEHAHGLLQQIQRETGIAWQAHATVLGSDVIDFVTAIRFPRGRSAVTQAHRALDLMHQRFPEAGFTPYRLDIEHMDAADRPTAASTGPARQYLLGRLKRLLDPHNLIAPGRYVPERTDP